MPQPRGLSDLGSTERLRAKDTPALLTEAQTSNSSMECLLQLQSRNTSWTGTWLVSLTDSCEQGVGQQWKFSW